MKIQSKKTTTTTVEVDVILPYYSKRGELFFYKVISENEAIAVEKMSGSFGIETRSPSSAFGEDREPSTAEEFNAKFSEVLIKLNELNHDTNSKHSQTTDFIR